MTDEIEAWLNRFEETRILEVSEMEKKLLSLVRVLWEANQYYAYRDKYGDEYYDQGVRARAAEEKALEIIK